MELYPFGLSAHALETGMYATDMLTRATLPEDTNSPYSYIYDRLGPFRERFLARAKPPSAFAVVLADTLEAKNPPIAQTRRCVTPVPLCHCSATFQRG